MYMYSVSQKSGQCLGNSRDNFQLHKITTSKNIAKGFRGATFLTHTVCGVF